MQTRATSYRFREDVHEKLRVMAFLDNRSQTSMLAQLVAKEYDLLRMQVDDPKKVREIEHTVLGHTIST